MNDYFLCKLLSNALSSPVIKQNTDPKRTVVAIAIGSETKAIYTIGYNNVGLSKRPFRDENNITHKYVLHAEEDMLLKLLSMEKLKEKLTVIINYAPCEHCAAMLVSSRVVDRVLYKELLNGHTEGIKYIQEHSTIDIRQLDEQSTTIN